MLTAYQGSTLNIALQFANDDGSVLNASGCVVRFVAKRNYVETGTLINNLVTGGASATGGAILMTLSTGDTNQCPGSYLAAFTLYDTQSGVSPFATDGLTILPSLYIG